MLMRILRLLSLVASIAISIDCLGITFSEQFKQDLAKLHPIKIQPMKVKEVAPESAVSSQSRVPDLEPDGKPITLTIEQLEKLGSKYLTNLLEEMDEPEAIQIAVDREFFELLLAAAQAYPEPSAQIPTLENLEKFLLSADLLNLEQRNIIPTLQTFSSQDLCNLYSTASSEPYILQSLNKAMWWTRLTWLTIGYHKDSSPVISVAVSPDNKYMVYGMEDNTIRILNFTTSELIRTYAADRRPETTAHVAVSPNSQYIISGSEDKTIKIWNLPTGEFLHTIGTENNTNPRQGHTGAVHSVVVSPDSKYIISGSSDTTVRVWDLLTGALIHTLGSINNTDTNIGHTRRVNTVTISPDGRYIISGSSDTTVRVWDFITGALLHTVGVENNTDPRRGHKAEVNSVAVSPDGKYIISAANDYTIRIRELTTYRPIKVFYSFIDTDPDLLLFNTPAIISIAVSPDSKYIVGGSYNRSIRIWKIPTGELVHTLGTINNTNRTKGHTNWITSVAISPNANYIISGSFDKTVRIWAQKSIEKFCQPETTRAYA